MISIHVSKGIELVVVDDGGIALKDLFNARSIAILPEELDDIIDAFREAKKMARRFKHAVKTVNVKVCKCSLYQIQQHGCQCSAKEKKVEYVEEMPSHYQDEDGVWHDENDE